MASSASTPVGTTSTVTLLEHGDLVGLFARHDQRLELVDSSVHPPPANNSPAKRAKGNNTTTSNGTTTTTLVKRFELNTKLFAINEPYLMKTERDAMVKMLNESPETPENGTTTTTGKNRTKKRKKAVAKKVTYLEQNLANEAERTLAMQLIEQCLIKVPKTPPKSLTKSPAKRKNSLTTAAFTEEDLLRQINGDANTEATEFVANLFRNRFESLNYRGKVFCNPYSRVLRVKIGLSNYLIPARCSFAGVDICEGIQKLTTDLKAAAAAVSTSHLRLSREPFYVVLDPAWDNNKSVKRKKAYETVSLDYLRRMCRELKTLTDLVLRMKQETAESDAETPPVIVAIWTTKADKDFVLEEMLPLMAATTTRYDLKWHKVTISGCPVKVHGGLEYLIIAERWTTPPATPRPKRTGLLVSVPSAVHSHKPSLVPIFRKLYNLEGRTNSTSTSTRASRSPDYNSEHGALMNYNLASEEIISPLMGVELFARYLQTGFHAIGYECIKLQNEELFTSSLVEKS